MIARLQAVILLPLLVLLMVADAGGLAATTAGPGDAAVWKGDLGAEFAAGTPAARGVQTLEACNSIDGLRSMLFVHPMEGNALDAQQLSTSNFDEHV